MVKQGALKFKLEMTKEEIRSRSGLAVYSEFMRSYGLKKILKEEMPAHGSNRGHDARCSDVQYVHITKRVAACRGIQTMHYTDTEMDADKRGGQSCADGQETSFETRDYL